MTVMRPLKESDLPALQAWDEDPIISELMGRKFNDLSVADWFRSLRGNGRAWAIESRDGRLIGQVELAQLNWRAGSAELRICIGEKDCWNQGFGTDAIMGLLRFGFAEMGLRVVYLRVFQSNQRAVHVYERLGFQREAVLAPCTRREDPAPVVLMKLTRERYRRRQVTA